MVDCGAILVHGNNPGDFDWDRCVDRIEGMPDIEQQITLLCEQHGCEPHRLLQILIEVQEMYTFIPPQAITAIARHLHLPRVSVEGVAGFYSFLSLEPAGRYRVLWCRSWRCRLRPTGCDR